MERETVVELVDRALAGDHAATECLFAEYRQRVWRLALRYTRGQQDDAKDILQETFMKAFQHLPKLREKHRFGPWLMQITSNAALQRMRSKERESRFLGRWANEQAVPGSLTDPLLRELKIQVVQTMLADLPETGPARIVKLHYGDPPMTTGQISEQLDIPKGTVTVTLKRFRDRIREGLLKKLIHLEDTAGEGP